MSRVTHTVPVEAVRAGVTIDGAVTLARLAALSAELMPNSTVELIDDGWVATVVYVRPGFPRRIHHAHVTLGWAPKESAAPRSEGVGA